MNTNNALSVASSKSTRVSLAGIRIGRFDLSERRISLLKRVPNPGEYFKFELDSIEMIDLAYLTAKTGDEFALLRSKSCDVLFHGYRTDCTFYGELKDGLKSHEYVLVGHSHPGEDEPIPSSEDRAFLRETGQKTSKVISARTGRVSDYTQDIIG